MERTATTNKIQQVMILNSQHIKIDFITLVTYRNEAQRLIRTEQDEQIIAKLRDLINTLNDLIREELYYTLLA